MVLFVMPLVFQVVSPVSAQADVSTSGYWIGIMPTYSFSKTQSVTLQAEARRQGDNSFTLIRPSYHYQFKTWMNVGLGADLFTTDQTETRTWVEFNLRSPSFYLGQKLHLRYRQEFRDLSGNDNSGARSRVMLMSQFSISEAMGLEVFVFDEVFYSQRDFAGVQNYYDRNWLGFRIRKNKGEAFYDFGGFWEKVFDNQKSEGFVGIVSVGYNFE
jgi:hypothetical protein